jgi:NHL repeat-containing protein
MTVLPGGGFLFSDLGNNVVRQVSRDGAITRVAGIGVAGDTGDGGPATQAELNRPSGVAVLPGGGFLVADNGNNVVRQVSRDGVITRVAGDTGDDGPATQAQLNGPGGVGALPGGGFLVTDVFNHVVREVEARQGGPQSM